MLYLLSFLTAPPFKRFKIIQIRFTYVCIYITRPKHLHMIKQTYCHCITACGQMNIKPVTTDSSVFWIRTFMWNASPLSPWVSQAWSQWSLPGTTVDLRVWSVNGVCMYHDWLLMKRLSHWRYSTKQQSVRVREREGKQTRSHSHWRATLINVAVESLACRGKGTGVHGGR